MHSDDEKARRWLEARIREKAEEDAQNGAYDPPPSVAERKMYEEVYAKTRRLDRGAVPEPAKKEEPRAAATSSGCLPIFATALAPMLTPVIGFIAVLLFATLFFTGGLCNWLINQPFCPNYQPKPLQVGSASDIEAILMHLSYRGDAWDLLREKDRMIQFQNDYYSDPQFESRIEEPVRVAGGYGRWTYTNLAASDRILVYCYKQRWSFKRCLEEKTIPSNASDQSEFKGGGFQMNLSDIQKKYQIDTSYIRDDTHFTR
jgi:hypothetical protein